MLKIYLIRHGKTKGNTQGRYIGVTDESLCESGRESLKRKEKLKVEHVYVSPLKRCLETAQILFNDAPQTVLEDLRECNFGDFENKNYKELSGNADYQKWIESKGTSPFPNGEHQDEFRLRCCQAFEKAVLDTFENGYSNIGILAHGGTIMSIMEHFSRPHKEFYEWQVKNARGYMLNVDLNFIEEKTVSVRNVI